MNSSVLKIECDGELFQIDPPVFCENFHDHQNWYWAAMIIGFISSILQIVGLIVNYDVFLERMSGGSK